MKATHTLAFFIPGRRLPRNLALPTILLVLAYLRAMIAHAAGQDLGSPASSTPYDGSFGPVRSVMNSLSTSRPPEDRVREFVRTARAFRYYMKHPYVPQTPAETESTRAGDCKAKSLWVADKMDDRSLRFVVGKARLERGMSHAWLLWKGPNGWLVLDPTLYNAPLDCSRLGSNEFVPLYSYTANGKFIHAAAMGGQRKEGKYADHL